MRLQIIEKRYLETSAGQIHLHLSKNRSKPPLILLHQTASSSEMYKGMIEHLQDKFWCIAPDMMGFGQSAKPAGLDTPISQHASLFWECLDQIGIKECLIFGHHTGASVGLQMAHDRPESVSKLALSGPPLLTEAQIEHFRNGLLPVKLDPAGDFLLDTWNRLRQKDPTASLELTLREALLTIQAGDCYPAAYRAVFDQPFEAQLKSLECPILLMAGEHDSLYASLKPASNALTSNPAHQVHHIPNAGSYICDQQPELVSNLLIDFYMSGETS